VTAQGWPTGTVTFLFTDIEGSTRLVQELGGGYAGVLLEHRRRLRGAFREHRGIEVDTQGDAFFCAFATATDAVRAARDGQAALAGGPVRVRMGIHTGEAALGEDGYAGIDVHRAARICAAGHGGQVLLSDATARLVDVDLHDLGVHRLKDLLAPMRLYQLGHGEFPPLRTLNFTNLPVVSTPLVGRAPELGEAASVLRECRLVTLVGPGGTGKTRLALQLGADVAGDFADGVFWVPLGSISDPGLVEPAIAQALGVTGGLAGHLAGKRALLVIDNFEQVVPAATLLAGLLTAEEGVKFLVTSREPLRLSAEREYPVLSLPHRDAVALFAARARALDPRFEADAAVGEICRRLDGLPLAIELAAARVKVLSADQILERLGHRLGLLTAGTRDAPARQQTLRATIDWSYRLLRAQERELLARLAIFAGGWTLEAAEAICGADLDPLDGLVSKSLVTHARARFGMLETVREYATELLDQAGGRAGLADRHAVYYLAYAERAEPDVRHGVPAVCQQREDEDANLRLALDRFAETGSGDAELRLAAAIWEFWFYQGRWEETRRTLERALATASGATEARVKALRGLAWITGRLGEPELAVSLGEEALGIARERGDTVLISQILRNLAVLETWRPDSDPERVNALHEESARLAQAAGDLDGLRTIANNQSVLNRRAGDFRAAADLGERAVALSRQAGDQRGLCVTLKALAEAEWSLGDRARARASLAESLSVARDLGFREVLVEVIYDLACLSADAGDHGWTAALLGVAQREATFGWIPEDDATAREYEQAATGARRALGDEEFEKVFAAGRAMPLDAVLDYTQTGPLAAPADAEAALALVGTLTSLRLSDFAVAGSYRRFDAAARQALTDLRQGIVTGLEHPGHRGSAHLIWAAPGSGTANFMQQVASSLPGVTYRELNLATCDEPALRGFLADLEASGNGPTLGFIEGCDAKPSEPWPYELMLLAMEAVVAKSLPVVFVLAGSSGPDAGQLQERIASRPKGAQLLSHIPHANLPTIPAMGIGDRVLAAASQLREAAEASQRISEVEKMALFYVAVDPRLGHPRPLRELCVRAAGRLLPGEERLRMTICSARATPRTRPSGCNGRPTIAPSSVASSALTTRTKSNPGVPVFSKRACGGGRITVHEQGIGGSGHHTVADDRRQRPAAGTARMRRSGPAGGRADRAGPARPLRARRGSAAVAR
jgi:predicted ATPase